MTSVFGIVGNKNFLFFPFVIKGKCKEGKKANISIENKVTCSVSSMIHLGAGVGEAKRGTVLAVKTHW